MRYLSIRFVMISMLVGLFSGMASPNASRAASIVLGGWDLFHTPAGDATFAGVDFHGVNLGSFDFGSGLVGVGSTDTIVHRKADASDGVAINIELVKLQLESVSQVNLGAGVGFYFITLDPARPSLGTMTITNDGTFRSAITVNFDIRKDTLGGAIVQTGSLALASSGSKWSHTAPDDALLINGINNKLNGTDTTQDFWGFPKEIHVEDGSKHDPVPAPFKFTPSFGMILFSGFVGLSRLRRRSH